MNAVQIHRHSPVWALAVLLLFRCALALPMQPEASAERYHFAIPKGSAKAVLDQFAKQTGIQLGGQLDSSENSADELGPFVGEATADEAMTALLKNTDLSYTWLDQSTIRVFPTVVGLPHSEDNRQEVVVTGTRLMGSEISPAPIRVYGRAQIERYGVATIAGLSRYLTQQPFAFGEGYFLSNSQFFQMRGLGVDTTLVLVNGRRMSPSANSIALNAVDLNNIPVSAIDRVEVLSDAASAIYGADAIGGVINVILKDAIQDPELNLHYGSADGGGRQRGGAVSLGFDNPRFKSTLVLDYHETAPLMGNARDLWSNQDYRRFGGRDYRVRTTNPGNVYSVTGGPLPGLSSSHAAVPLEARGMLSSDDFIGTDGATNLESSFRHWSITPQSHRASAYATAEYSLGPELSLFEEVLAVTSDVTTPGPPPSLNRQVVPTSNPFNPFGTQVAVDYSFAGMAPVSYVYESDLLRLVAGARGVIGQWDWEFMNLVHREDGSRTTRGNVDVARVDAAVASEDPQTALNLFSDGPGGTPELLESLLAPPQRAGSHFSSAQVSAFVRGPMFGVGEREAQLVVGAEWRHDAAGFFESNNPIDADREIASAFLEARLPLLSKLTLKLAARGDRYGDGESIWNPQYGLTWQPTHDWHLRAAFGTSFRPPSLSELYMPTFQPYWLIPDPRRGGEVSSVRMVSGGNPDLEAVTAHSFTAGFVFNSSQAPGLRLGGNYWRVVMENRILVPSYQSLLDSENESIGLIERDAPTEKDLAEGWAGRLRSIDLRRLNFGYLETSGIDLDASLQIRDSFQLNLGLTWVREFLSRDLNPILPLQRVGIANIQGTIPAWRAVGSLAWRRMDFGASTTATLVASYHDADVWEGPLPRQIGSQFLLDVQAWAGLSGSIVTFGARNVLDRAPEFANAGASFGYDASQSELTRRIFYCRLSKRF